MSFSIRNEFSITATWIVVALWFSSSWSRANASEIAEDTNPILPYDQLDIEARRIACRQDPLWVSVDYHDCQNLMGWKPRYTLWHQETEQYTNWLDGKESEIEECLKEAFENAKATHEWAR